MKMKVVVNKLALGNREQGYELFDGKGVLEVTGKQIKEFIKNGEKVCGLVLDKNGELELDKDGFFTTNIMVHRHIGHYEPMIKDGCMVNNFLTVVGKRVENGKTVYEAISSRFERIDLSEYDVKAYINIGIINGGVKLDGTNIVMASMENKETEAKESVQAVAEKAEPEKPETVRTEPAKHFNPVLQKK